MVIWIEDAAGNYVDTSFITRATGLYGLGNRPGMLEFNTAYRWPYGRRETTFPVWAHRHGQDFPLVVFQNWKSGDPLVYTVEDPTPRTTPEENLSHALSESSTDAYYCRPFIEGEPAWDAETCATPAGVFTDKGAFHPSLKSLYPPRSDLQMTQGVDAADVSGFAMLNPFDAISRATPIGGADYLSAWPLPESFPEGDYVVWIEVSKESDENEFYSEAPYGMADLMWGQYGVPYLGQPSVVYRVPFSVSDAVQATTLSADFVGYGDPDGLDGDIREPDGTISETTPASGAARLQLVMDDGEPYRVKVVALNEDDEVAPGAVSGLELMDVSANTADLSFVATGDDGASGAASSYEIRYLAGEPLNETNFESGQMASGAIEPVDAGLQIDVSLTGLLPSTNYYVGVRAVDNCLNPGPLSTVLVTTPAFAGGEVDACFVATAAYGSFLADEVSELRLFRDRYLSSNVPGKLAVLAYYTLSPPMAQAIAPSDILRGLVRHALAPWIGLVRQLP